MWEYLTVPDGLRLPPCPGCGSRYGVAQVAAAIFVCTDCRPVRAFGAVWRDERAVPSEATTVARRLPA
jgi:ribosomal protein L37AE/L43A